MLEIGSSLREARIRHGVELAQVDADTHIRTRYLKALEDERFDLIPGDAYVRGFLRTYADYLGLDAELFVDEYKARFAPPEESSVVGSTCAGFQRLGQLAPFSPLALSSCWPGGSTTSRASLRRPASAPPRRPRIRPRRESPDERSAKQRLPNHSRRIFS